MLWLPHFRTFCELVEGEENKLTIYIFHMDYNVRVQHHFPAASLQTWATPEIDVYIQSMVSSVMYGANFV